MIAWLNDNWTKLKDFIVYYYAIVVGWVNARLADTVAWLRNERDVIVNAVNTWTSYLQQRISEVATTAWNNLVSKWNEVRASISGLLGEAKQWALDRANDVRSKLYEIRDWLISKDQEVRNWIDSVLSQLRNTISSIQTSIQNWVNSKIQNTSDWITSSISNLRTWVETIPVELHTAIDALWTKVNSIKMPKLEISPALVWAYIEGYFTEWIQWWLACQLWSSNDPLPPKPTLFGGGGSGGIGTLPPGGESSQRFVWPVASRYISGYTFNSVHKGVDIGINTGDPVCAIQQGTVINSGWSDVGYGFMVRIAHPGGWFSLYAHLLQPAAFVGDFVTQGQLIGIGDSTGHSTGPHLHLEIYNGSTYYDPLTVLP
jgi:murein DD-endopeptidase MepM/ murein hydrolase activator NlpD